MSGTARDECRRELTKWKALAILWRNHAHELEDRIASAEADSMVRDEYGEDHGEGDDDGVL